MRFGLQLETYTPENGGNLFDRMRTVAQLAERAGFASIWYEGHLMFRAPDQPGGSVPQREYLTTLAVLKRDEKAGVEYTIVKLLDAGEIEPVRLFAETMLPAFPTARHKAGEPAAHDARW